MSDLDNSGLKLPSSPTPTPAPTPTPPPPAAVQPTGPEMSVGQTLTGIFFEPTKTFESLRGRPRFLVAMVLSLAAILAFMVLYNQRIGHDKIIRQSIEDSPRTAELTPEQRQQQIDFLSRPVFKVIFAYGVPIVFITGFFFVGAALYLLGSMLMGGRLRYKQGLAVWTYSGLPPILLSTLINIILVFVKSEDTYDIVLAQRSGLVQANLNFLVDPKVSPAIYSLLGSIDVFQFYGLFLAALGLRLIGKLSSGGAWTIVIALFLIGVVLRVGGSLMFGAM